MQKTDRENHFHEARDSKMDKQLPPRTLWQKYWIHILSGVAFLIFLTYVLISVSGGRKLRIDGEKIVISDVQEAHFLDYVDAEGIVQPILTIKLNTLEAGMVQEVVAEEGSMMKARYTILALQNPQLEQAIEEQQDEWSDLYEAMAQDDSALQTLYFYLWSKSSVEFVSQSNMDPKHKVLRIQVEAPDAYKILEEVRTEAEQGQIDLSDPDVVRPAVDQKSALYYYVIDHYDMLETPLRQEEVVVNMYLEGNFNTRAWRIDTSQELHDILAGNVKEAGQKVFAKPLDVPKS